MKLFAKFALCLLVYLAIGTALGLYRIRGGGDGWGKLILLVSYPVAWPFLEVEHYKAVARMERQKEERRQRLLAGVCPPAYQALFYKHVLDRGDAPSYRELVKALAKAPPDVADIRSAYVLNKLAMAVAAGKDDDVLDDAAALLESVDVGTGGLLTAAAMTRGYALRSRGFADPAGPRAELAARLLLAAYVRSMPHVPEAEDPYAALAFGAACHAASRILPGAEASDLRNQAREWYARAIISGKVRAAFPAAVLRMELAADAAERKTFLSELFNSAELSGERLDRQLLGDVDNWTFSGLEDGVDQIMGKNLLPPLDSGFEKALDAIEQVERRRGSSHAWTELLVFLTGSFDDFSEKIEVVETCLDRLLSPNGEIVRSLCDRRIIDNQRNPLDDARQIFYRLYDESGDERWLEAALPSLLRLRPSLRVLEKHLEGEIAFLRGQYRRHFELSAEHLIRAADPEKVRVVFSTTDFLSERMYHTRIIIQRSGPYHYDQMFNSFMYDLAKKLENDKSPEARRRLLGKLGQSELTMPNGGAFVDDSDVDRR